jgi:hypothetical protein
VNSFWLSGCGRAQPERSIDGLVHATHLRAPLVSSNWPAWAEAWQALDANEVQQALKLAQQGQPITLTLCGERLAQRYEQQAKSLWSRMSNRLSPPAVAPVLEAL